MNQSAFNAVAIDAKKLHNSTQTLAGALTKVPGVNSANQVEWDRICNCISMALAGNM